MVGKSKRLEYAYRISLLASLSRSNTCSHTAESLAVSYSALRSISSMIILRHQSRRAPTRSRTSLTTTSRVTPDMKLNKN